MAEFNIRRLFIGKPLATEEAAHERLNIPRALAVFSSDALSSSAYATEAILLVLITAGAGALGLSWPIAIGIATLLIIVAFSYFQTIHAYPNGGGAYIVSAENLGRTPSLIAAAALLIDYILTVAVSVSAGVAALTSAFPVLTPLRIEIALVIVVFITVMNLRGIKESGTFFAIPVYAFIVGILAMLAIGAGRVLTGNVPVEVLQETAGVISHDLTLFLILRAFAAGCTAMTGVEAISNGIPSFQHPASRNAGRTLVIMVTVLCVMFLGITFLANHFPIDVHVHVEGGESAGTVLSQIARNVFGDGTILFFYIQFATLFILSLAANTAYAGFPLLASLIARDRFLPRQLTNLGDRLVFSNGIVTLAVIAGALIILFDANEHNLLPLYAVGVFISFTLSQSGMVVHWLNERKKSGFKPDGPWYFKLVVNTFGAVCTFVVMLVLMVTKFTEGAWLVIAAIPVIMVIFMKIHEHYKEVAASLTLEGLKPGPLYDTHPDRSALPVVVLMNSLNRASLQALEYAMRLSSNVRVCSISVEEPAVERLKEQWNRWKLHHIPLDVVISPYREVGRPLIEYLHEVDAESKDTVPTVVVIPQFVVEKWWERYLHNQTTTAIRDALHHDQIARGRGRPVIDVPYRIGDELYVPGTVIESDTQPPVSDPTSPTA